MAPVISESPCLFPSDRRELTLNNAWVLTSVNMADNFYSGVKPITPEEVKTVSPFPHSEITTSFVELLLLFVPTECKAGTRRIGGDHCPNVLHASSLAMSKTWKVIHLIERCIQF